MTAELTKAKMDEIKYLIIRINELYKEIEHLKQQQQMLLQA
jgi:hypothetical protein